MTDYVKVYRHSVSDFGIESYDGWFFSKIFALKGNYMLVYDNGENSGCHVIKRFIWVDFSEVYTDLCSNEIHARVELLEDEEEVRT